MISTMKISGTNLKAKASDYKKYNDSSQTKLK